MKLDAGARALGRLNRALTDEYTRRRITWAYADAIKVEATRRAQGRPTPQAPAVARALWARGSRIKTNARATIGGRSVRTDRIAGAEFGSNTYRQFRHAHTGSRGIWFYPAGEAVIEDPTVGDDALDEMVKRALGG